MQWQDILDSPLHYKLQLWHIQNEKGEFLLITYLLIAGFKNCPYKVSSTKGSDIGYHNSNVIKLPSIIAISSFLGCRWERSLPVLILRSLASKCRYLLSCHLRLQPSPDGMNNNSSDLIIVQVIKQSISSCNYNITSCNRKGEHLFTAKWGMIYFSMRI